MLKKIVYVLIFSVLSYNFSSGQNIDNLKDINTVWAKFYQAFETLDYTLMAEIHSKDLVRVSGGRRILDYDTYITNYKAGFERDKKAGVTSHISLRFFERLNNDNSASERGVYKLVRNKGKTDKQAYYGQFHILFKKLDDHWKITMDYDSSEGGTIGEDDYQKAFTIDDFEKY